MAKLGQKLLEHEFIWLTLAVYLGTVVQEFFTALSRDILLPVATAAGGREATLETWDVKLFGQTLRIGDFLVKTGSLLVALAFIGATVAIIGKL